MKLIEKIERETVLDSIGALNVYRNSSRLGDIVLAFQVAWKLTVANFHALCEANSNLNIKIEDTIGSNPGIGIQQKTASGTLDLPFGMAKLNIDKPLVIRSPEIDAETFHAVMERTGPFAEFVDTVHSELRRMGYRLVAHERVTIHVSGMLASTFQKQTEAGMVYITVWVMPERLAELFNPSISNHATQTNV